MHRTVQEVFATLAMTELTRAGRAGLRFAPWSSSQQPFSGLLAIFEVGPARPAKKGQDRQHGAENKAVALHGDRLSTFIVRATCGGAGKPVVGPTQCAADLMAFGSGRRPKLLPSKTDEPRRKSTPHQSS